MITNDGKEILSKFILGQVPSFATHLSIGCGANPLDNNDPYPNTVYSKKRLDFEMTRVPISSKGFIDDSETYLISDKLKDLNIATLTTTSIHNIVIGESIIVSIDDPDFDGQFTVTGVTAYTVSYSSVGANVPSPGVGSYGSMIVSRTKISLTAELPSANRYEITEVGVWSAGSNSLATLYDSRMIFNFSQNWQKHSEINGTISTIPTLQLGTTTSSDITTSENAFFSLTNDILFQNSTRKLRKEGPRHLNKTLLVAGDFSKISPSGGGAWTTTNLKGDWVVDSTVSNHIHLNDINFDISGNNASDILKLAFSIVDKTVTGSNITDVKILLEFIKNEASSTSNYAKMQVYVPGAAYSGTQYLNDNKYYVASAQLSQNIDYSNYVAGTGILYTASKPYIRFYTSSSFSPTEIRMCRIYVMVNASETQNPSTGSANHYVCFDGLRIDNTTENPVYKMCGYSIVRSDGTPITKLANTNNYVDFRLSLGVT